MDTVPLMNNKSCESISLNVMQTESNLSNSVAEEIVRNFTPSAPSSYDFENEIINNSCESVPLESRSVSYVVPTGCTSPPSTDTFFFKPNCPAGNPRAPFSQDTKNYNIGDTYPLITKHLRYTSESNSSAVHDTEESTPSLSNSVMVGKPIPSLPPIQYLSRPLESAGCTESPLRTESAFFNPNCPAGKPSPSLPPTQYLHGPPMTGLNTVTSLFPPSHYIPSKACTLNSMHADYSKHDDDILPLTCEEQMNQLRIISITMGPRNNEYMNASLALSKKSSSQNKRFKPKKSCLLNSLSINSRSIKMLNVTVNDLALQL